METGVSENYVYIVISQTGTILSRLLKILTHREYNHASLSLNENLDVMYSFGRKNPYNPFFGGFVKESANFGTFKRFSNTKAVVLKLSASDEEYQLLNCLLCKMISNPKNYKYNYLGLCLAGLRICFKSKNRYYCSEFVRDILIESKISGAENFEKIVHPMSFLALPESREIFCGRLKDYTLAEKITV